MSTNPLTVAVLGCGPAGLLCTREILKTFKSGNVHVHLFGDVEEAQPYTRTVRDETTGESWELATETKFLAYSYALTRITKFRRSKLTIFPPQKVFNPSKAPAVVNRDA